MSQIAQIHNLELVRTAAERLAGRTAGLPGMAALYGPAGYGKTTAALAIANEHRAYFVQMRSAWGHKALLEKVLIEMGAKPAGTIPQMLDQVDGIEITRDQAIVRLYDKSACLDKPVCAAAYAGNNVLPGGLEGTVDDIKGQPKPRVFGRVFNISPPRVNTSRLIYEVGACQSIDAAYDRGAALTKGADYASQGEMEASAPAAGYYRAWPAGGYFRIGSSPAGQITVDVTQGAAASNRTAAQLLQALALIVGLPASDIAAADIAALDALNGAECGLFLADDTPALAAMDQVAAGIGAWFGFDPAGQLRLGRLDAPGVPAAAIAEWQIIAIERGLPRDNGTPIHRAKVRHSRNHTVQETDLAGVVTPARRAFLGLEYRTETAEDAGVQARHLLSGELERETCLVNSADAAAEAARLLALHQVARALYRVTVESATAAGLALGQTVSVTYPRFGLDAGRPLVLIGLDLQLARGLTELTFWG